MTVTLVWRTDVHLSDHTPVSRTDVWSDTVLAKLKQVGDIAKQRNAHAVLDGGDFFDLKSPSRNSHSLVRRAMEVHRGYPCPVYANVGNHDCVYGDYNYLHQQPLGVMYESGVFKRLYDTHEAIFNAGGIRVRVVGIPYHGTRYDLSRFESIKRGDEDYLLVVAHLLASQSATTMFDSEDVIKYEYLDTYPADCYMFGHWHKDQGIHTTRMGKKVVNIGSLTRGSLSEDDMDRIPAVVVLTCTPGGLKVEKVPLVYTPAQQVFDVLGKQMAEVRTSMMEDFASHLKEILLDTTTKGDLRDKVRSLPGVTESVRERTILYVEKAEGLRK